MPDINETALPGVGVRHDFTCTSGDRVGVVSHRGGRRDLIFYDPADPDAAKAVVEMAAEESSVLADLLGGSRITERIEELQQRVEGLAIDWLPIPVESPYAGLTIADAEVRTRTGVSIVALLREDSAVPAPEPDTRLDPGDTVVVVGTPEGINALVALLRGD